MNPSPEYDQKFWLWFSGCARTLPNERSSKDKFACVRLFCECRSACWGQLKRVRRAGGLERGNDTTRSSQHRPLHPSNNLNDVDRRRVCPEPFTRDVNVNRCTRKPAQVVLALSARRHWLDLAITTAQEHIVEDGRTSSCLQMSFDFACDCWVEKLQMWMVVRHPAQAALKGIGSK